MFDSATINIPCPECSRKTSKTIGWIKSHNSMTCSGCGASITLDKKDLLRGLQQVDKSIQRFSKAISKTITIKL
jgi:transposase-like protein